MGKFIKKHHKEDYEVKCPNCGSENISEITGWCYTHNNPVVDEERPYCQNDEHELVTSKVKNAFICNDCDTMFDESKMANWNWSDNIMAGPPVGIEVEETPDEYADKLLTSINRYSEVTLENCVAQGHYLEAIGTLHIQISEQLRFLMVKRIKSHEAINLDPHDVRFTKVVNLFKEIKDRELYDLAFIFGRVDLTQYSQLKEFNILRNDFSHSFKKRERYSERDLRRILDNVKSVERTLKLKVDEARTTGELPL